VEERFSYYTGVKKFSAFKNDKTKVEEMDEPILNKTSKIDPLDNRSKIKPNEELGNNIETEEEMRAVSPSCSNSYLEKSIKKEVEQAEFETGMAVLEKMDESSFNKIPKTEPLDIKPKIEPKDELDNNIETGNERIANSSSWLNVDIEKSIKKEADQMEF